MATTVVAEPGKRVRPRWRRIAGITGVVLLALIVLGYFGVSAYMFDKLTRPEKKALVGTPAQHGMTYQDVVFTSTVDNIPLRGWLVDSPGDKAIIMLHGRLANRSIDEALDKAAVLYRHNYDLLMFDFRDSGESGGDRYTLGAQEMRDLEGALSYMKGKGYSDVGTYGVSMGAATSLLVAPDHPEIKALLVDSSYADLPALIDQKLPESSGLPALFNPGVLLMGKVLFGVDYSGAKPAGVMAKLGDRPILQVYSKDGDKTVPLEQHYALAKAGASDPNFSTWAAPGSGHVDAFPNNKEEYSVRMVAFYDMYLK